MLASEQFRIRKRKQRARRRESAPPLVTHHSASSGAAHTRTGTPHAVGQSACPHDPSTRVRMSEDTAQDDSPATTEPLSPAALLYRALQFRRTRRLPGHSDPRSPVAESGATTTLTPCGEDRMACAAWGKLDAEDDEGDVEYKWRLTGVTTARLEHLVTQMQFRVTEGKGQCLYELGVADDGTLRGLPRADFEASVKTIELMASKLGLEVSVLQRCVVSEVPEELWCGEVMVSRRHAGAQDVSVAFCGAVGTGKSTLIGVLLSATLDDGSGGVRQSLFNHKHEVDSGRTSSIATRVWSVRYGDAHHTHSNSNSSSESCGAGHQTRVRADAQDAAWRGVVPAHRLRAVDGVARSATAPVRLISLTDLGGDITKTMLFGLMSRHPDYVCLCVAANSGDVAAALLYAQVCRAMRVPFVVAVTMCDLVEDFALDAVLMDLAAVLRRAGGACDVVEDDAAVLRYAHELLPRHRRGSAVTPVRVPVFALSSVTGGVGLARFRLCLTHLHTVPTPPRTRPSFEVLLDHDFVVQRVGPVVQGRVSRGSGAVEVGCRCYIGPDVTGGFHAVTVRGIHVEGAHVNHALPGDEATFALDDLPAALDLSQKGKVLVRERPVVCTHFSVVVRLLSQSVTDQLQPILFTRNARQAIRIHVCNAVDHREDAGLGAEYALQCVFMFRPEVVVRGAPVVLHWDPSGLAVGHVTAREPYRAASVARMP